MDTTEMCHNSILVLCIIPPVLILLQLSHKEPLKEMNVVNLSSFIM